MTYLVNKKLTLFFSKSDFLTGVLKTGVYLVNKKLTLFFQNLTS